MKDIMSLFSLGRLFGLGIACLSVMSSYESWGCCQINLPNIDVIKAVSDGAAHVQRQVEGGVHHTMGQVTTVVQPAVNVAISAPAAVVGYVGDRTGVRPLTDIREGAKDFTGERFSEQARKSAENAERERDEMRNKLKETENQVAEAKKYYDKLEQETQKERAELFEQIRRIGENIDWLKKIADTEVLFFNEKKQHWMEQQNSLTQSQDQIHQTIESTKNLFEKQELLEPFLKLEEFKNKLNYFATAHDQALSPEIASLSSQLRKQIVYRDGIVENLKILTNGQFESILKSYIDEIKNEKGDQRALGEILHSNQNAMNQIYEIKMSMVGAISSR